MARDAEFKAKITAQDDASKVIDKVADKADELDKAKSEVKIGVDAADATRDIGDLLKKVDALDSVGAANLLLTTNAQDITQQVITLVGEIDKLDSADPEFTVKADQITQLEADLEQLSAKAKEINGTPIALDTKPAVAGLDEIGKSADSSKSVLANMIGNSVQDIGALEGVSGSAGVAIGQMGEYMADAMHSGESLSSALKSFAGVAGPIAALALATKVLGDVTGRFQATQQRATDSVTAWEDALRSGGDAAKAYGDSLDKAGKVTLDIARSQNVLQNTLGELDSHWYTASLGVGLLSKAFGASKAETKDMTKTLAEAGLTVGQWTTAVEGGADAAANMSKFLATTSLSAGEQRDVMKLLSQQQQDYATAAANAAAANEFFGNVSEETTKAIQKQIDAIQKAADKTMADAAEANAKALQTQIDALQRAADGALAYANAVNSADFKGADWGGAQAGLASYSEVLFGLKGIASDAAEANDKLVKSVKDNGFTFDLNTEKGRANEKALEDLSKTIDTKLTAAYMNANGSQEDFVASATKLGDDTLASLAKQMGLSTKQTDELRASLGLTATDYEARFKLSGDEEAKMQLGLLQGAIDSLPKDVQAQITQQIIMGDYQGAIATVKGAFAANPATQNVNLKIGSVPSAASIGAAIGTVPIRVAVTNSVSAGAAIGAGGRAAPAAAAIGPNTQAAAVTVTPPASTSRHAATVNNVTNNVNVYVPQGYRERDAVEAAYRSTIRSGRLYANL